MDVRKEKCCRGRSKPLAGWRPRRAAGAQKSQGLGSAEDTPVPLAPPFLCPRNCFPCPIVHRLSFLPPLFFRNPLSNLTTAARAHRPEGTRGCFRAKARRRQGPGARRPRGEETPAPAATEAALRAPRPRATHRGALGQVVATQSVVQVEADHVAGGQGEVLSHGCAGGTAGRRGAGELAGQTLRDGTWQDERGAAGGARRGGGSARGGAGLRPPRDAARRPVALPAPASTAPPRPAPPLARAASAASRRRVCGLSLLIPQARSCPQDARGQDGTWGWAAAAGTEGAGKPLGT